MSQTASSGKAIMVILVLAGTVWLALGLISSRLEANIESMLQDDAVAVLGLKVEIQDVDVRLASGRVAISGLKVANPAGFPSPTIFDMQTIEVDMGMLSLLPGAFGWKPYKIEEIRIQSPVVSVDVDDKGQTNLDVILNNIRRSQQDAMKDKQRQASTAANENSVQKPANKSASGRPESEPATARLTISQLKMQGLSYQLRREGEPDKVGTLPDIEMQNVGGEKGATAAGIGLKVSTRLAGDILSAVLLELAIDKLNGSASGLLKMLQK